MEGQWYYDRCLPMDCSSSSKTFGSLSTAMEWIARNKLGIPHILHILDDFPYNWRVHIRLPG